MSTENLKRWNDLVRVRQQTKKLADMEAALLQSELSQVEMRLDELHREFEHSSLHCRQRLPAAPHLAANFQASLNQLKSTIGTIQQQRDGLASRLAESRQRQTARNIELEQVESIRDLAAEAMEQIVRRRESHEIQDHILQQWSVKSRSKGDA